MRKPFPFDEFESKWQAYWDEQDTYRTSNPGDADFDASKPKYYVLDMFPYPSGAGLHVGHPEGYTATDIIARYKRMKGFNVLHPMGWDAFGLPAEQYAIKTGQHPRITTEANTENFRNQLKAIGFSYDWNREINTTDPDYVRWTQWIFLHLYNSYYCEETQKARPITELEEQGLSREAIDEQRLAFTHEAPVNWSPDLGTVLANEEVEEWKSKGHTVERRPLRQWMLRITKYAQRLIDDLDALDWPESIKLLQKNWIGKSEGASVTFEIAHTSDGIAPSVEVFTTRPDTLYGATYMVLAPEHPLVPEITMKGQLEAVEAYKESCALKSDLERGELNKEKTGVDTGAFAINPANGEQIPIWISDYVMMGYGTGAIMSVPAHDERDYEFAQEFGIAIKPVVTDQENDGETSLPYTGHGTAINSAFLDGLATLEAKAKMIEWLEENGKGTRQINFKLRDWLFSRQRYWGEPFPLLWDKETGEHACVPESDLPVLQPEMEDFKPTGDPRGPLVKAEDWINYSEQFTRETNTMPQWAGSCWYYLRYCDPRNTDRFISEDAENYWSGGDDALVDLYVGGTEHAVLHLLYARFWHKVLYDLGLVSTIEPFKKLVNQGLILGEDGNKMSKSIGNVVNPDDIIKEYGADSLRLYEMFMGPLEQVKPWQTNGVDGVSRFLAKVWRLACEQDSEGNWNLKSNLQTEPSSDKVLLKALHQTIKKVGEDIENLAFNTAISQMMVCLKAFQDHEKQQGLPVIEFTTFLQLLNTFAPHLTEELNKRLGSETLLSSLPWPAFDESKLVESEKTIIVQVNGKLRARLQVPADISKDDLEAQALADEGVTAHTDGKTIRKVIVVPGKLVNIVAN